MGHLVRSLEIARALASRHQVWFVSGGQVSPEVAIPPGVELVCLPALQTDTHSTDLHSLSVDDLDATKQQRKDLLLSLFHRVAPHALLTEMFPFGRKQFEFELIPVLEVAKQQDVFIACSVRDILVRKRDHEAFEQRVAGLVNRYYDLVLIHGDPQLLPFEESFSRLADLACQVQYTGYVTPTPRRSEQRKGEPAQPTIVVSNGGGRCEDGHDLIRAVVRAAALLHSKLPHRFDIFAGPLMPPPIYSSLAASVAELGNVRIQKYTSDLSGCMARADLSISMGGYNTVMDILQSGARALVYPVVGNGDQEQEIRAAKLGGLGVLHVARSLDPGVLADQIQEALTHLPSSLQVGMEGAQRTLQLLTASVEIHRSSLNHASV